MTALLHPVTADLLARVSRLLPDAVPAGDLIELARMVRNGDLLHVDAIPAWLEAQEQQRLYDEMVDECRQAGKVS